LLAALYVLILLVVRGAPIDMTRGATVLVGALLVGVGSVMGRMRPNAVMGVRTPWTLASQAAWDASHRLGGWLFIAIGALLALGGLFGAPWLMVAGIIVLFLGVPVLIGYGYWICRSDPNRLPKGQTLLTARVEETGVRSALRSPEPARDGSQESTERAGAGAGRRGRRQRGGRGRRI
jgi:hypothetical protein